jgi:hypothetical protein
MKSLLPALSACVLLASSSVALAAENPAGTWKWTVTRNDQTREASVTLKVEGEKLTGTIPGRNDQTTAIEEGTFKGDEITFKVTRERDGQKFTQTYKAKISGDTLKGTIESVRDGQTQSRPWEAKRST